MFDNSKFANAKFGNRTEGVNVDVLSDFFPKKEKPIFIVRGLTHHELSKCAEGIISKDNTKVILEAVAGNNPSIKEAIGELIGGKNEIPLDTQKRILHLVAGSLKPEIDESMAVKLAETFPIEFILLTNKIVELTGLGQVAIKKR